MNRKQKLLTRYNEIVDRQTSIRSRIDEFGTREDDLTEEETTEFRSIVTEFDTLEAEAVRVQDEVRTFDSIANAPTRAREEITVISKPSNDDVFRSSLDGPVGQVRDAAKRVAERALAHDKPEAVEAVFRAIAHLDGTHGRMSRHIVATGRPAYRSAFAKVISGQESLLSSEERAAVSEVRAASLTDAAGGYAVPFTLDPTIIDTGAHAGMGHPWRRISQVKRTLTNEWNGVSSAGVTVSWDGEATQVSDDTPTLAQPTITCHKAQGFVPFSIEISQDWAGMEGEIRSMFGAAKDDLEEAAFVSGSGTGQPKGIVTALDGTAAEIAPTTAEAFAVADLFKLENALAKRYRARARWVADKPTYNSIRAFGTADSYALWTRLGEGVDGVSLMGYPHEESPSMRATNDINVAATADNFILILGDFNYYYIVDRVGMSVEFVPHLFGANGRPTGQRGLYMYWRAGADCVNAAAFAMLNVATTA